MSQPTFTVTSESISVILDGKIHTVANGSANYKPLWQALKSENWEDVPKYLTVAKTIEDWAHGDFKVTDGSIFYKGEELPKELNKRIIATAAKGDDPRGLMRFWEKLQQNPSWRSVQQLFSFLQHQNIPIDENGDILAYKSVSREYKDHHTGEVDNSPGAVNRMSRNKISDDPNVACHFGYHVGALAYAQTFGGSKSRILICRINPADVVCIPHDSSAQKMRVCEYAVLGNYGGKLSSTTEEKLDLPPSAPKTSATPKGKKSKEAEVPGKKPDLSATKGTPWEKFGEMDEVDLLNQQLDPLRKYARHVLQIVGASKIPGGKPTLIERILDVRSK